ncbi:ABC transporter substrate-binding protein [Eubacterium barkeri]|uniref:NitT/TauT family transport system substrate-binding protein n=1 Tax=Eubacterium barkeri TaxID=1528 RepID=A0A1H3HUN8_EUBBA|nr:ABC transporter substrate-binding protein [Eubacterium barkeri]SDY18955.1 NitT/TauT family transport system substrate-binding protein [Eubacterium barkeri]
MKKVISAICTLALAVLVFAGCSAASEPQTVKIAALSGPTGIGMSQMIVEGVNLGDKVTAEFTVSTAPDQVVASVINGDYQIASVPTNAAATIYNKTEGSIVLGAVNTLGTLSILADKGEGIGSIADLKGKTSVATGQGSTPEYVLNYLLTKNGLTPGQDVTIEWLGEHAEAAAKLANGEATIAMLPQPFATATLAKNAKLANALDLTKAWEDATGSKLEMGCIVVNKEWAEKNQKVFKQFMEAYQKSVDTINTADEKAGQLVVDAGIMESAALAQKAIPNCAITLIAPGDAKEDLQTYYQALASYDAKSIGGKVPDEAFYSISY